MRRLGSKGRCGLLESYRMHFRCGSAGPYDCIFIQLLTPALASVTLRGRVCLCVSVRSKKNELSYQHQTW